MLAIIQSKIFCLPVSYQKNLKIKIYKTDHWEDLGVGRRITLRWTLGRQGSMRRTAFGWLRIGSSGGLL
jgi:hypothetical protein